MSLATSWEQMPEWISWCLFSQWPGLCWGPHAEHSARQQCWEWGRRGAGNPTPSSVSKPLTQPDVEVDFQNRKRASASPASIPRCCLSYQGVRWMWAGKWLPANACAQLFSVARREHTHMREQHLNGEGVGSKGLIGTTSIPPSLCAAGRG